MATTFQSSTPQQMHQMMQEWMHLQNKAQQKQQEIFTMMSANQLPMMFNGPMPMFNGQMSMFNGQMPVFSSGVPGPVRQQPFAMAPPQFVVPHMDTLMRQPILASIPEGNSVPRHQVVRDDELTADEREAIETVHRDELLDRKNEQQVEKNEEKNEDQYKQNFPAIKDQKPQATSKAQWKPQSKNSWAENLPKSVTTPLTEVVAPATTMPFKKHQKHHEQREKTPLQILKNQDKIPEMFVRVFTRNHGNNHADMINYKAASRLLQNEDPLNPTTIDDIVCYSDFMFVKQVDLGRQIKCEYEDIENNEASAEDEKLYNELCQAVENGCETNNEWSISSIKTRRRKEDEYDSLVVEVNVYYTEEEKNAIMKRIEELRKNPRKNSRKNSRN